MPIFELFSERRRKALRGQEPEVFQYEILSEKLKTQLKHIFSDAIGNCVTSNQREYSAVPHNYAAWEFIRNTLRRELGKDALSIGGLNPKDEVLFLCMIHLLMML
jgi:hypothetical protein